MKPEATQQPDRDERQETSDTPDAGITPARPALRTTRDDAPPYVTRDGSIIRELMHPAVQGNTNQSLAEARIPAGTRTLLHQHNVTEELYHVTQGTGLMQLGAGTFTVTRGDTVCIPPKTPHCITASDDGELVILCCCAPAYSHADTDLLEDEA